MKIDFASIKVIRVCVNNEEIEILNVNHSDELTNNIFDLKQFRINYELDAKYTGQENKLKFYYSDENQSFKVEIHMPTRNDTHFNEFVFKNSLKATIDKKRLENLYEKNAIGFLATEENLEDEDFVNYIKELMVRFSWLTFRAFYFNDEQKQKVESIFILQSSLEVMGIKDIYELTSKIEILVLPSKDELSMVSKAIIQNCSYQFIHFYIQDQKLNMKKIVDFSPLIPSSFQYEFLIQMGVSEKKIEESGYNLYIAWFSDIYESAANSFNEELEFYEFSLGLLNLTLTNKKIKDFMIKSQKKYYELVGCFK
jgi:hypothetical protein